MGSDLVNIQSQPISTKSYHTLAQGLSSWAVVSPVNERKEMFVSPFDAENIFLFVFVSVNAMRWPPTTLFRCVSIRNMFSNPSIISATATMQSGTH